MLRKVFGRREEVNLNIDIHNHLLPGVDDGVREIDESVKILEFLKSLGYQKVIITPHIYPGVFPNTEKELIDRFKAFKSELDLSIEVQLAAEYYSDETLLEKLKNKNNLLTFGNNHILIETSFFTKSILLDEVVFQLMANNYKPVLAHPERYVFAHEEMNFYRRLKDKGVLFQINAGSIEGSYGKEIKNVAEYLIKNKMVDFIGSDIHRMSHARILNKAIKSKLMRKVDFTNILNNKL